MTDYWTILGNVAGAIFGPGTVMLAAIVLIVVSLVWASYSSSSEADFPWWVIAASWVGFVVVVVLAASLMLFLVQFGPFSWRLQ